MSASEEHYVGQQRLMNPYSDSRFHFHNSCTNSQVYEDENTTELEYQSSMNEGRYSMLGDSEQRYRHSDNMAVGPLRTRLDYSQFTDHNSKNLYVQSRDNEEFIVDEDLKRFGAEKTVDISSGRKRMADAANSGNTPNKQSASYAQRDVDHHAGFQYGKPKPVRSGETSETGFLEKSDVEFTGENSQVFGYGSTEGKA